MSKDTSQILRIHKQFLLEQQYYVADSVVRFLSEAHNTGIKKSDLKDIEAYLKELSLTEEDDLNCYLEVLSETELSDKESVVSALSDAEYSDVEDEKLSEDETTGAILIEG